MTGKERVDPSNWLNPTQERQGAMSTRLITGCLNVEKLRGSQEKLLGCEGCRQLELSSRYCEDFTFSHLFQEQPGQLNGRRETLRVVPTKDV